MRWIQKCIYNDLCVEEYIECLKTIQENVFKVKAIPVYFYLPQDLIVSKKGCRLSCNKLPNSGEHQLIQVQVTNIEWRLYIWSETVAVYQPSMTSRRRLPWVGLTFEAGTG